MDLQRRVDRLEETSGLHAEESIISICSNVKTGNYQNPEAQLEQQRARGKKRIVIRKYCGSCMEPCRKTKYNRSSEASIEIE